MNSHLLTFLIALSAIAIRQDTYSSFEPIAEAFKSGPYYDVSEILVDPVSFYQIAFEYDNRIVTVHFLDFHDYLERMIQRMMEPGEFSLKEFVHYFRFLKLGRPTLTAFLRGSLTEMTKYKSLFPKITSSLTDLRNLKPEVEKNLRLSVGPLMLLGAASHLLPSKLFPSVYMVEKGYNLFYIEHYQSGLEGRNKPDFITLSLKSLKQRLLFYKSLIDSFMSKKHEDSIILCTSMNEEGYEENTTFTIVKNSANKAIKIREECMRILYQIMPLYYSISKEQLVKKAAEDEISENDFLSLKENTANVRAFAKLILILETNAPVELESVKVSYFNFKFEYPSVKDLASAVLKHNLEIYHPTKTSKNSSFVFYREFITCLARALGNAQKYAASLKIFHDQIKLLIELADIVESSVVLENGTSYKLQKLGARGVSVLPRQGDEYEIEFDENLILM